MSTKRHLRELQWRFMLVALFFMIGALIAYAVRDSLIPLLMAPLHGERLIYLNPAGGFSFIFLVSVYAGIALAFPVFIQQAYGFLRPALPVAAQKKSAKIILASLVLLIIGIAFGYFVAVPNALNFLYSFADKYVEAALTADSYLNFIIAYTVGIGIVFQVPLLLLLVHSIRPLTPGGMLRSEKWVILVAFIVAAIITPTPDPVNQTIVAVPVIVVYQLGVLAVLRAIYKTRRAQKKLQKQALRAQPAPVAPVVAPISSAIAAHIEAPSPTLALSGVQPSIKKHQSLDGFRRVTPSGIQNSPSARPIRQAPQPALNQASPARRNFSIDGVHVTRRATGYQ